jgi:hypothetical protein
VLCKHTAWVVVDREGKVLEGDPIPVMQILDEPAGWAMRTALSYSSPMSSLAPDRVYARMSTALRGPDYALPSMVVGSMPSFRYDSFIGGWGDIATSLEDLLGEMRTTMVLAAEQAEQILELVRQFPRNERRRVQRLNLAALVGRLTPVSLRRIEKVLSDLIVIAQGLGTSDGIPF